MKKKLLILFFAIIILSSCSHNSSDSYAVKSSFVAKEGDSIYYIINHKLYKKTKEDCTAISAPDHYPYANLVLCYKGKILAYYENIDNSTYALYDIMSNTVIKSGETSQFIGQFLCFNDYMLYLSENDGRYDLITEKNGKIVDRIENVKDYNIIDSRLYYSISDDEMIVFSKDIGSKNKKKLFSDKYVLSAGFYGDIIAGFTDTGTVFYNLKKDISYNIEERLCVWSDIFLDGYIFASSYDSGGIFKIYAETGEYNIISRYSCDRIAMIDGNLYLEPYDYGEQNENSLIDKIAVISTDGTLLEMLD